VNRTQFRVLYRQFLFRIVDLELLSKHAQGDSRTLLGQFGSLLVFVSLVLALVAALWGATVRSGRLPQLTQLIGAWSVQHFLIATTMLAVGLLAALSWESTFPDRQDRLVLGPLPVRARTLFLAKIAAVATALGLTLAALHALAGIAWPLALAQYEPTPAPALAFDPALPPLRAADFPAVMERDMAPLLGRLDRAATDGGAGVVIGVSEHGALRVMAYGSAKPDSLFEIASITKTFTGLLLAQMAVEGTVDLRDPVRETLPPGVAPAAGFEITLLDLATHHSGLPRMPDNAGPPDQRESYTNYRSSDLLAFLARRGLGKPANTRFEYSNLGFAVLGAALAHRAQSTYPELVRRKITGPLGMNDTVIALSPEQAARFLPGYDSRGRPTPPWDLDAFASAGGIRSTAGDMLTYLQAQLHPEASPLRAAIAESQRVRGYITGNARIALAWAYDPATGVYAHDGATDGFTSYACFNPQLDFAAIVMMNARPVAMPVVGLLGEHVRQRLSGEPTFSLTAISVPPAGPVRSLCAYWVAMLAAGVFMFCCVLALQGAASQLLPRQWFLRTSALLQLAVFSVLVSGYFLQQSPATVLVSGTRQPWLSWIPSYWFVGLYQQLSGSLHPALAPFARRAWIGLAVAVCATAAAYAGSYVRALRMIVEQPDVAPAIRQRWLPRFRRGFHTAIVHFSIRSLLRSRQHRLILAFYLALAFAFSVLFLNAPQGFAGLNVEDPWQPGSVPLLASTLVLMSAWVAGARVVFSLPLELRANWIFRVMPFRAGLGCIRARRGALLALAVAPAGLISAALLFSLWPWRLAAAHLAVLGLAGVILTEFSFTDVQKIPFTCSYLPGRSNLHLTFWLWLYLAMVGVLAAAEAERNVLASAPATAALLAILAIAAAVCVARNHRLADAADAELRFEEIPPDQLVRLNL
jgi:CubicO group peptidase (beta-lactamase class C family)